jgi:hypothetical protein
LRPPIIVDAQTHVWWRSGGLQSLTPSGEHFAWRCSTPVCGNEPSPSVAPPSQASRLREARISARTAAA